MRFPVDASALTFRVVVEGRADTEYETGNVKKRNGNEVWVVTLVAMDGAEAEQIRVRVPGPIDAPQDAKVRAVGLSCLHWSMEGRSGLSFAADRLELVKDGASKPEPAK